MRIDKWLCYVRIFKTRTLASEACRGNLVKIDGKSIKPSREIEPNEVITIEKEIAIRKTQVLDIPSRRVSAKEAEHFRKNLTEEIPQREKFDFLDEPRPIRKRGSGRPTKKERREMDSVFPSQRP